MSYSIDGKDIVIKGFEEGIAETPYAGIADIRNINLISMPGEASVNFKTAAMTIPPTVSAVAWTAVAASDTFTVSSTSGWYNGMAVTMNTSSGGGVATGRVYWVGNLSGNTFKLYKNPARAVAQLLDVTGNSNGTMSSYTMGAPLDRVLAYDNGRSYPYEFILDTNGLVWWVDNTGGTPTTNLIYIGNDTLTGTTGRAIQNFQNYLIVFRTTTTDYLNLGGLEDNDLDSAAPTGWGYGWESMSSVSPTVRATIVGQDGGLYYNNDGRLGSILVNAGSSFDPSTSSTYTKNTTALSLPDGEEVVSLGELGVNLLIGGRKNLVYPWNRVSTSFTYPLILPETNIAKIVQLNSNAFLFAGNRGRIFVTNGTNINLWKKVPDYITGVIDPYITWGDAYYWKNQIYFSFTASTNAGAALSNTAGVWAIDTDTEALRYTNLLSYGAYTGTTTTIMPNILTSTPGGTGLYIGWSNSSTYGVDYTATTPYSSSEAYLETDIIPVGTYLSPFTPSQIEWKTSVPLGSGGTAESISLYYRTNLSSSFTLIGTSTATGSSMVGTTTGTTTTQPNVSDYYETNFERAQWVQIRAVMSSNATTPTYCRLTEIRIREWPSEGQKK